MSLHYSAIQEQRGFRGLKEGKRVEFRIEQGRKGQAAVGKVHRDRLA